MVGYTSSHYLVYTSPMVHFQTQTAQRIPYSIQRNSFKEFLELPAALPHHKAFQKEFLHQCRSTEMRTRSKTESRFRIADEDDRGNYDDDDGNQYEFSSLKSEEHKKSDQPTCEEEEEAKPEKINLKKFPKKFNVLLFAFAHNQYNCHGWRLTAQKIFKHENLNFNHSLDSLLSVSILAARGRKQGLLFSGSTRNASLSAQWIRCKN